MEPSETYYSKEEYIETYTGNRVSRKSVLCGSQNIRLQGKVSRAVVAFISGSIVFDFVFWFARSKTVIRAGSIIRGDLANVAVGKYCFIGNWIGSGKSNSSCSVQFGRLLSLLE